MKTIVKRAIKDEKGQAMLLAVILLLVGGLIVASLLSFMGTGLFIGPVYEGRVAELYGADAGVEDAVWRLQSGEVALCPNQSTNYTIDDVNGKNVAVTITHVSNTTNTATYLVESTATGDGSGTKVDAYIKADIISGDYSGILDNILTSQGALEWKKKVNLDYPEGNGPAENYTDPWPPPGVLSNWYWQDVKDEPEYGSGTIDLAGIDSEEGPLYRNGTLDIYNSINTPATLTLTGTLYITGDTQIGATWHGLNLDLNGQTIFVESSSTHEDDGKYALEIGTKTVNIIGPGVIMAIGDIYFAPNGDAGGEGAPVFVFSATGTTTIRPGINIYGAVAGSVEVDIQSGNKPTIIYPEGGFGGYGLNFPIGGTQYLVYSIASWEVNQI